MLWFYEMVENILYQLYYIPFLPGYFIEALCDTMFQLEVFLELLIFLTGKGKGEV